MLSGALRTKERKAALALIIIVILIIGAFIFYNYSAKKKYEEQAVMAEEYLASGDYVQAVNAYLKALSMKKSEKESMTIGLAQAYIGVNDYDKALEVLRNCYQDTGGLSIKEKIEEVTSEKTDHDFNQTISGADTYFSNSEYEKAIAEYEKAKLIKSKEVISYLKIAKAYIALKDYDSARKEAEEGLAITESSELKDILSQVDAHILKVQYDGIVKQASEYIYQENYEDAVDKFKEAISILPKEESAYSQLAEAYITLKDYEAAINLLQKQYKGSKSDALTEVLSRAIAFKQEKDERNKLLKDLYTAMNELDTAKIVETMRNSFFVDKVATGEPIYYSAQGEGKVSEDYAMIILDRNNVYAGEVKDYMKKGSGVYFILKDRKDGNSWYYYEGEWNNDIPNGMGKVTEEDIVTGSDGKAQSTKVITEGNYVNGYENGEMHKYFYTDGQEDGDMSYTVSEGVPKPYTDENGGMIYDENNRYAIGEIYHKGEPTGEYYYVGSGYKFSFKLFS